MKIAVIATVWFPLSHADVIVTRWVKPFPTDGANGWTRPESVIASAWIEQRPATDLGVGFCADNGILLFDTIEEALTLGTGILAVDGVLLIGEHGDYPRNEFGQKLYPRKRLFDEIVRVFSGIPESRPNFQRQAFQLGLCRVVRDAGDSKGIGISSLWRFFPPALSPRTQCRSENSGREVREAFALYSGGAEDYGVPLVGISSVVCRKTARR